MLTQQKKETLMWNSNLIWDQEGHDYQIDLIRKIVFI